MLVADFLNHFSKLEDPGVTNHNTRHKCIDILVLAFVGIRIIYRAGCCRFNALASLRQYK